MLHAFSTLGCAERSLAEVGDLVAKYSVDGVELRGLGGTLDLPTYFQAAFGTPEVLIEALRRAGAGIVSLDTGYSLVGAKPGDRAEFLRFVPWAEALGVPWLRVFDGKADGSGNYAADLADSFGWWEDLRKRQGWRTQIMVETHDSLLTRGALVKALASVPSLSLLWDTHHTWRRGGEPPSQVWSAIRARVVHIHVKDSLPRPSAHHPFTYTLPGEGDFPMAELRRALAADGYDGFLSLEWERWWHPYLPALDQALACANRGWW